MNNLFWLLRPFVLIQKKKFKLFSLRVVTNMHIVTKFEFSISFFKNVLVLCEFDKCGYVDIYNKLYIL